MSALFHDVAGFPPNVRAQVREAIVAYDRSVLTSDFHAVERTGEPSVDTNRKLDDLYDAVQTAEPEVGTSAFYPQAVSDLSDVTKARRNRNADAADTIPGPLFFLVVVISFAVLGVATLLNHASAGRTSRSSRCLRSSPRSTSRSSSPSSTRSAARSRSATNRCASACSRQPDADRAAEHDERGCDTDHQSDRPDAARLVETRHDERIGLVDPGIAHGRRVVPRRGGGEVVVEVTHVDVGLQVGEPHVVWDPPHAAVGAEVVEQQAGGGLRPLEASPGAASSEGFGVGQEEHVGRVRARSPASLCRGCAEEPTGARRGS